MKTPIQNGVSSHSERGLSQICDIEQDTEDPSVFEVLGKDRSWFNQKGAVMFGCTNPEHFRLNITFLGNASNSNNHFGNTFADLSRQEQSEQANWMVMAGVAPCGYALTGCSDCKQGFYFLFHVNYRRTSWRIVGCPHDCELVGLGVKQGLYTCDPQGEGQLEIRAWEGQELSVEYSNRFLWVLYDGVRVARGCWLQCEHGLPEQEYRPVILTANCRTKFRATVS